MFKKAVKTGQKVKMAIVGPAGSGKTFTALRIARGIGGRTAVIDSEHGSSRKYAGEFDFDICELEEPFTVEKYREALREAVSAGYDCVVMDSISHAWAGPGGVRDVVDNLKSSAGGGIAGWKQGNKLQNSFVEEILAAPTHVLATMRTKMDYSVERDDKGKTVVRKLGMAPVQRDGMEYEFDLLLEMDEANTGTFKKSRCKGFQGRSYCPPDESVGRGLVEWLSDAEPETQRVIETPKKEAPSTDQIVLAFGKFGLDVNEARKVLGDCTPEDARLLWVRLNNMAPGELKAELERRLAS
jgi:DNA polymerase III delta prime subunit